METGPDVTPVTRRSLALAMIDFLDGTELRLVQLALNTKSINLLRDQKSPFDSGAQAQKIQEQAIQTANELLAALGGIAIYLRPDDGSEPRHIRLTGIRGFSSPEGPPTWLAVTLPTRPGKIQHGEVAIDFRDAREQLHEP